jgi:large subunit ribosomal protein L19
MKTRLMQVVEDAACKKDIPDFEIGDTVDVHQRILEGQKERTQVYNGVVIARRGEGMSAMFTVRRIVQGEGVERSFPLHSTKIAKIEVKRTGTVRRAKLYYLRDRVGKATRLRERKGKGSANGTMPKKGKKAAASAPAAPAVAPPAVPQAGS